MYGIVTDKDNFVADNMIDPSGEARKGILLFKKKTDAVNECETLNELRGKMKLSKCYSVIKFKDDMDVPYFGIILDDLWKQSL